VSAEKNAAAALGYLLERGIDAVHAQIEATMIAGDQIHTIEYCARERVKVACHVPPIRLALEGAR
jgi:hypothetical protein